MAISHEWHIEAVDVYPSKDDQLNVIHNVRWVLNATDTEVDAEGNPYVASVFGGQDLDTSDLSNFTEFDNVTSLQVQEWIEAAMGEEELQFVKDELDARIDRLKNPASVTKVLVN